MKLAGSAVLGIDRDRVWSALQNPAVLVRTIPGCERLEETGPDTYRMTVTAGVASIKGVYQGEVALSEPDAPQRFVLRARGQGAPGTVDATVEVRLSEIEGGTRIDYDAEAVIGGMIGGVGQRMLSSVVKKTAGEFFSAVESHLSAAPASAPVVTSAATFPAVTPPAAAADPAVTPQVFERPAAQPRAGAPVWPVLAAFGMGAGIALGSAVIGWLLGRTGRKS
ncbi:SRPBCC family protein [Streptosporangium roseum]|uniref:Carbon monoxide dehydrogenase subunit G n=1 Tax=Streptosporangium roseum (strain ATCC 12428 / DSM 43021 / JCM 3005 / KCTC 9067 / NCIMB 10171 / NRRL 2505 / NI 9100) TaxID=479432 RepID=D2B3T1_STRRD|nr:carbon monoxide dehydrogenase subunit G [Streptosporangium roseum]ACZ89366.1 carbon monoxide dehydrogenase subunit G [Streptosporangium roseum DSM 43021]